MNPIRLRRLLRRFGVDLCRRMPRVVDLLDRADIQTVFDVGANMGQTGEHLRAWGYAGRIVSFEPVSTAFAALRAKADRDPFWEAVNVGMGSQDGAATINVSERTDFSSLRPALPVLERFHEQARYVRSEAITIHRLDSVFEEYAQGDDRVFVKVDTQGFEREVLEGAAGVLPRIAGFQLELSLEPMYAGEATFLEISSHLENLGYRLVLVESVSYDEESQTLHQVDGFYLRV